MTACIRVLQPRDPLICRDGRPLEAGFRGHTMEWPLPSVLAGTARTNLIEPDQFRQGAITSELAGRLLQLSQRGPLPAWRSHKGGVAWQLAFPAPADALAAGDPQGGKVRCYPLRPDRMDERSGTDLGCEGVTKTLVPAVARGVPAGKPPSGLPRFWKPEVYQRWLGWEGRQPFAFDPRSGGVYAPRRDTRVHVAIDAQRQTAEDGALFSTEALDFGPAGLGDSAEPSGESPHPELGLYTELSVPEGMDAGRLHGLLPMGGEGRLSDWRESANLLDRALNPDALIQQVLASRCLRLMLLTPAWFGHGWQAEWMRKGGLALPSGGRLAVTLVSAVVPRFVPISGWDLLKRKPKPTHFLAPAGAVYFFRIGSEVCAADLRTLWLHSVTEEPEAGRSLMRDGFGLTVFGSWKED